MLNVDYFKLVQHITRQYNESIVLNPDYTAEQMVSDRDRHLSGPHDSDGCKFCDIDAAAIKFVRESEGA